MAIGASDVGLSRLLTYTKATSHVDSHLAKDLIAQAPTSQDSVSLYVQKTIMLTSLQASRDLHLFSSCDSSFAGCSCGRSEARVVYLFYLSSGMSGLGWIRVGEHEVGIMDNDRTKALLWPLHCVLRYGLAGDAFCIEVKNATR